MGLSTQRGGACIPQTHPSQLPCWLVCKRKKKEEKESEKKKKKDMPIITEYVGQRILILVAGKSLVL